MASSFVDMYDLDDLRLLFVILTFPTINFVTVIANR